jgi:hypothetical protein
MLGQKFDAKSVVEEVAQLDEKISYASRALENYFI